MNKRAVSALAVLIAFGVGNVHAQAIEEIVVTATKREQSINDVPIAISAYNRETVHDLGIRSAEDMEQLTPGLEVNTTGGVGTKIWTIRGVGFNDYSTSATSTVGLYFDEVAIPYPVMATGMFFDTERIEVVRGPQGDLYGRNTTAGQVSYVSAKPTDEFQAGFNAGIGNFETFEMEGFVSGPLSDSVRGRIAVATTQRGEGWQESLSRPGDKLGEIDRFAVRAFLDLDIGDIGGLLLKAHYNNDQSDNLAPTAFDGTIVGLPFPTRHGAPFNTTGQLEQFVIYSTDNNEAADWTNGPNGELRPRRDNELSGVSAKLTLDIGELELVSVTGFDTFERSEANDWDGTALNDSSNINVTDIDVFSQEIRLSGDRETMNWLAGVYYASDDLDEDYNYFFGEGRFGINQLDTRFSQETDAIAVFGHAEWDLTDRTSLILGLRYTSEDRLWTGCTHDATPPDIDFSGSPGPNLPLNVFLNNIINGPGVITPNGLMNDAFNIPNNLPLLTPLAVNGCGTFNDVLGTPNAGQYGVFSREISADETMWKVGLDFAPNDDVLLYGTISKGFKSGGFNGANSNTHSQLEPYRIEEVLAYEAGIKATLLEATMQLNGSVFYYDYTDKQERNPAVTPVGNISGLTNIPESEILGAEVEIMWQATDSLLIQTGLSFLDTEVKEWMATDGIASSYPNEVLFDASGSELPNAPNFSGNLTVAYEFPVGSYYLEPAFDLIYRGETTGDIAPENMRESYTLANARVTLSPDDSGRWAVQLWSRNLFDEDYYVSGQTGGNFTVVRTNGLPRTWGLNLEMNFE
jgi:iron complex outermembrane receptor protein